MLKGQASLSQQCRPAHARASAPPHPRRRTTIPRALTAAPHTADAASLQGTNLPCPHSFVSSSSSSRRGFGLASLQLQHMILLHRCTTLGCSCRQPAALSYPLIPTSSTAKRRGACRVACAALPASLAPFAAASAAQAAPGMGLVTSAAPAWWSAHLPALITSIGVLIASLSAAAFLLCAIPALWAMIRVAYRTEAILQQVERELPETAAILRLSGLEVTDCISEMTGLGSDLSSGVRSTANLATAAEAGLVQGVQGVQALGQHVGPALATQETAARSSLEAWLQQRANLTYTKPFLLQVAASAASTTAKVRRARLGLRAVNLGWAARAFVNQQALRVAAQYSSLGQPKGRSEVGTGTSAQGGSAVTATAGHSGWENPHYGAEGASRVGRRGGGREVRSRSRSAGTGGERRQQEVKEEGDVSDGSESDGGSRSGSRRTRSGSVGSRRGRKRRAHSEEGAGSGSEGEV